LPRNRKTGRIAADSRMPTAGHKTGIVQKRTGESSEAPTWMRETNHAVVPRSKETNHGHGWKTNFRDEFAGAHGAPSGAVLDDNAQSIDAPAWMAAQTKLSPRSHEIPLYKQTGRGNNDLGVQAYKAIDKKMFQNAYGAPSGAALDDSAQSADAPTWMAAQTKLSPRGQVPLHKKIGRNNNDLGVQAYKAIDEKMFYGAAGHSTGAVMDDSAESGDAPKWMRNMGAKQGVPRSQHHTGVQNHPMMMSRKTTFGQELFDGRAGRPTGAVLDDSAQSNDAPEWMENQTKGAPRKKLVHKEHGWKTDFTKDFEGRMGKPSGAVHDDSAESGDAPDWMQEQSYLSPRGTVPRHKHPGQNSNDLGVQSYRAVDVKAFQGAAGESTGTLPDDSAVSKDLPEFMMIPEIPVHPGRHRQRESNFGHDRGGEHRTGWRTETENEQADTAVSRSAPDFFHIQGVVQHGEKYIPNASGGVAVGSKAIDFENAAGVTTGGVTDDSSVSAEMPEWMRNKKHVHVRNSTQRGMGLGHVSGKPVPRISHKNNNTGGYNQKQYDNEKGDQRRQHRVVHRDQAQEKFVPSIKFQGQQPGYLFQKGEHGMGYYIDLHQQQQHQQHQQHQHHYSPRSRERSASLSQAGRQSMNYPPTSSNPSSRPVTGSKPKKFPLGKSSYDSSNRGSKLCYVKAPYGSMKGPIPTDQWDANDLPLDMQHQYYTFSTPKHLRLQEKMKMNPPEKYEPFMRRHQDVPNHKQRPTTRMKGSISHAKKDYDGLPLRHYVDHSMMIPRARELTKSRVAKRELTSRGLSPRGPQRANGWRQPRGLLSTQGRGQHPTVTSQQAPTWMASGVTTNQRQRGSGIRC
jgi:hypothetical protein